MSTFSTYSRHDELGWPFNSSETGVYRLTFDLASLPPMFRRLPHNQRTHLRVFYASS